MDQNLNNVRTPSEQVRANDEVDIIELDDRLDMTFDPLVGLYLHLSVPMSNCNNKNCGGC